MKTNSGCISMIAFFVTILMMLMVIYFAAPVSAHEPYTEQRDPVTGFGCCGEEDCAPVPLDSGWVEPLKEGYQITMTKEQVKLVNAKADFAINEIFPSERVMPLNGEVKGQPAIYHICFVIWEPTVRCLFVVPST